MTKKTFSLFFPADKSVLHRALILAAMAKGKSKIYADNDCDDISATVSCLKKLGISVIKTKKNIMISGGKLKIKKNLILNTKESATSMRLLTGLLCGITDKKITITGSKTLLNRSMEELKFYLSKMGAKIETQKNNKPPITIKTGVQYPAYIKMKSDSAQIKSALILAALGLNEHSFIKEKNSSRDHTERLLKFLKADISVKGKQIKVRKSLIKPFSIEIPGDFSSAAYFLAAGVLIKNARFEAKNILLNLKRTGFISILKKMGAKIEIKNKKENFEPTGDIIASFSKLKGVKIGAKELPFMIDEIPLIALTAAKAIGKTEIKISKSLKNKESDRVKATTDILRKLKVKFKIKNNTLTIWGPNNFEGGFAHNGFNDHRIIMCLFLADALSEKKIRISGKKALKKSYPSFEKNFIFFINRISH